MISLKKAVLLVIGCLVFVFAISIGLSINQFGYVDWKDVGHMFLLLLMLVPFTLLMGIIVGILQMRKKP